MTTLTLTGRSDALQSSQAKLAFFVGRLQSPAWLLQVISFQACEILLPLHDSGTRYWLAETVNGWMQASVLFLY